MSVPACREGWLYCSGVSGTLTASSSTGSVRSLVSSKVFTVLGPEGWAGTVRQRKEVWQDLNEETDVVPGLGQGGGRQGLEGPHDLLQLHGPPGAGVQLPEGLQHPLYSGTAG